MTHRPSISRYLPVVFAAILFTGCASFSKMPEPSAVRAPEPILGNTGRYMSPYTEYGTVTEWVKKGRLAGAGAAVGGAAGRYAGKKALQQVPLIGGILGRRAGNTLGREAAMAMVGGESYLRDNSDMSFNSIDDLCVYLYARHSGDDDFQDVLGLTTKIYPAISDRWDKAIRNARR